MIYTLQQQSDPLMDVSDPTVTEATRPPITPVYSRRKEHTNTCPAPTASSLDPPQSDLDLPIALRKGKHQCTYPIANFVSYNHLPPHLTP